MKRIGHLTDEIADLENLRLAFWKAKRKKSGKEEVRAFSANLDKNLLSLSEEISNGDVSVGEYSYFKVYDPKERLICAAGFHERVLHHAIMNVCDPVFEKFQIYDSYATRRNKGQFAALEKVKNWARDEIWFCKLDARKYFDSINHKILYKQLCDRFKDERLMNILWQIINSYSVTPSRGVPIGNLTSQYFANFYLAHLDHFVKEKLRVKKYIRYMDDMVMLHSSKEKLLDLAEEVRGYCKRELELELKPVCLNKIEKGIPFLGFVLFQHGVNLNKNSKKRFLMKHKRYARKLQIGEWSQKEYAQHAEPLFAFTRFADTLNMRRCAIRKTEAG
jgi:retron-type reverse transcriptase